MACLWILMECGIFITSVSSRFLDILRFSLRSQSILPGLLLGTSIGDTRPRETYTIGKISRLPSTPQMTLLLSFQVVLL